MPTLALQTYDEIIRKVIHEKTNFRSSTRLEVAEEIEGGGQFGDALFGRAAFKRFDGTHTLVSDFV